MTSLKKLVFRVLVLAKNTKCFFYKPTKNQFKQNIPYHSQFASREHIDDFLSGNKSVLDDPKWKASGTETREQYAIWAWNGCGMACLQMILEDKHNKKIPFAKLGEKSLAFDCYTPNKIALESKDYKNYYNGLFYSPFLTYIQKEYNLKGKIVSPMIVKEIVQALDHKQYVIASVHPGIRTPEISPTDNRGHLILVVGYDWNKKVLYLHNPSGLYKHSQEFAKISFKNFSKFFQNRGMIIY